uniref:Uncharacterized protein n=1 Tax=Colobus angolensis palliatus TaxID=336983 RepID=A0A2K5HTS3_COLAP
MKPILTQMLVPIHIKGYLLGKKKSLHPQIQKNHRNIKKSASDFSTRQRSTPLLPMRLQEGFLYYTYIYVLVGKPC